MDELGAWTKRLAGESRAGNTWAAKGLARKWPARVSIYESVDKLAEIGAGVRSVPRIRDVGVANL